MNDLPTPLIVILFVLMICSFVYTCGESINCSDHHGVLVKDAAGVPRCIQGVTP